MAILGAWVGKWPALHAVAQLVGDACLRARTGVVGASRLDRRLGRVQSREHERRWSA